MDTTLESSGPSFKTAKCPECGSNLQVPENRDVVMCRYCRAEVIIQWGASVPAFMVLARAVAASGNYAESYRYYAKVLEVAPHNADAWFGKAVAAGWLSTMGHNRFAELCDGIKTAIGLDPSLRKQGAEAIGMLVRGFYAILCGHLAEYDNVWPEYVDRAQEAIRVLRIANRIDPANEDVVALVTTICKDLLDGFGSGSLTPQNAVHVRRIQTAFSA